MQTYFNNNEFMENDTLCNSETDLIEIRHIGVTARIKSPLKNAPPECSTAETDDGFDMFQNKSTTIYSKFTASDETETSANPTTPSTVRTEEDSKLLYEMHAERGRIFRTPAQRKTRNALTKIEFKLHNKQKMKFHNKNHNRNKSKSKSRKLPQKAKSKLEQTKSGINCGKEQISKFQPTNKTNSFLSRLRLSLSRLFANPSKQSKDPFRNVEEQQQQQQHQSPIIKISSFGNVEMGFYPFERGSADYLRATDSRPDLSSDMLAERANRYATRFWAEFFGALHIGVSLLITFVLQTYRFVLYTLINTLLVGLLRMTSDYFVKPLLSILFNGFLQPSLIFLQNIFNSLRDALNPVADGLNSFMKPIATLGRSLRLIHAPRIQKLAKDV